jgi:hypothetical protein
MIRIHIILQNLDDCAAEWLMAPRTSSSLLQNLTELYPTLIPLLPSLRFVEQYDPADETVEAKSQPYAYVADSVHEVKLGEDVSEVMGRGIKPETWDAMVELRDKLAPDAILSWFVVVCGDVERWAPPTTTLASLRAKANGIAPNGLNGSTLNGGGGYLDQDGRAPYSATSAHYSATSAESQSRWSKEESRPSTSRSIKKFFGEKVLRKTKRYELHVFYLRTGSLIDS